MSTLKKPDFCPTCNNSELHREFSPERWICANGHTALTRVKKISGVCKCGALKGEVPFKDGKNMCMICYNIYMKEWSDKNRDKLKADKRQYYAENRVELRERANEYYTSTPELFMAELFRRSKRLAVKKYTGEMREVARDFDITTEFLIELWYKQEGKCAITGVKMKHKYSTPHSSSLDRKDSSKGYTKDNVQLVCKSINMLKNDHTQEEVMDFIEEVKNAE